MKLKNFYILCLLCLTVSCKKVWHKASSTYIPQRVEMSKNIQGDPAIEDMIQPYKSKLDAEMNKVIATCLQDMPKQKPESVLGNWMADALEEKAEQLLNEEIAFALQNYGGIRIPVLAKGPITKGKIFELMPFENNLMLVEMNGATLRELILHLAADNGWPVSSSIKILIEGAKAKIDINGKPIQLEEIYKVAMPDYIANGGNDCFFLMDQKKKSLNVLIRDVLIEYVENKKELKGTKEGRFVINN